MQLATYRSGQIESTHDVSVVVVDGTGNVVESTGASDLSFYYRSAIKPFQATISQEAGAGLSAEQLAVACASHGGYPLHLGLVESNLTQAGLTTEALQCPPAWPRDPLAKELLLKGGVKKPARLFHNCSGKHSAWLAAAVAEGWPTDSYLNTDHPLQQRVIDLVKDVTGVDPEPVGVDGCGAPTLRGDLTGLARGFGVLSSEPRFAEARQAISRFPAIVSSNMLNDGKFAAWWGGPVKVGAEGLIGVGRNGIGAAAKSHEGNIEMALAGLLEVFRHLGMLSQVAQEALVDVANVPVLGGGRQVGAIKPIPS